MTGIQWLTTLSDRLSMATSKWNWDRHMKPFVIELLIWFIWFWFVCSLFVGKKIHRDISNRALPYFRHPFHDDRQCVLSFWSAKFGPRSEIVPLRTYCIIYMILTRCSCAADWHGLDGYIKSLSFDPLYDLHDFDKVSTSCWSTELRQNYKFILCWIFDCMSIAFMIWSHLVDRLNWNKAMKSFLFEIYASFPWFWLVSRISVIEEISREI
jgi:hypothetical protein